MLPQESHRPSQQKSDEKTSLASNGRFKPGAFVVRGQRTIFQGYSFFPPNDVAQYVIVVANHVIALASVT